MNTYSPRRFGASRAQRQSLQALKRQGSSGDPSSSKQVGWQVFLLGLSLRGELCGSLQFGSYCHSRPSNQFPSFWNSNYRVLGSLPDKKKGKLGVDATGLTVRVSNSAHRESFKKSYVILNATFFRGLATVGIHKTRWFPYLKMVT